MAMPYDAERVMQLRSMLREARKQKLSAGSRERREKGRHRSPLSSVASRIHFVVTGPDIEPMKFKSRREAKD